MLKLSYKLTSVFLSKMSVSITQEIRMTTHKLAWPQIFGKGFFENQDELAVNSCSCVRIRTLSRNSSLGLFTPETNWWRNWPNELMNLSTNWTNALFPTGVSTPKFQFVPQFVQEPENWFLWTGFCGWIHTKLFAQFVDELVHLWCE